MITLTETQFEKTKDSYKRLQLYKTDKNGSNYYHGVCPCDRCNGAGVFYVARVNEQLIPATPDSGTCWKCGGAKWINEEVKVITEAHAKHLADERAKRTTKKLQDVHQRMEETTNAIYQNNLKQFHPVNFTIKDWFKENLRLDLSVYKYYKIDFQTDRAVFVRFMCDLHEPESRSRDRWVPLKAVGGKEPLYLPPKEKRQTWSK